MCALYKRGKVWWYHFVFEGHHIQASTGLTNKTSAKNAEFNRETELRERRAGIVRKPRPPKFDDYVPQFLAWSSQQHRRKTCELHKTNCDTLLRFFTGKWLDEITQGMVEDFKLARSREERRNAHDGTKVAPATVNRALTTLKLIFNRAANEWIFAKNPTARVAPLKESPDRMRILNAYEEFAYLQAASQPLRDIAGVMLDTGMRPEEVFRIEVANLNFERRTIFNPHGKTPAARRTVSMTEEVWRVLKDRAIAARGRYVFPSPDSPDKPIGSVRKAHDAAVRRAHIVDHFVLYALRHTYGSRAAMAGTDLLTLAALMGHTRIQMTMRYVHPSAEHMREAVARMENFNRAEVEKMAKTASQSLQFPLQ